MGLAWWARAGALRQWQIVYVHFAPGLCRPCNDLGASIGQVQASLMAFFVAMSAGQIIYGPGSDMLGRRRPIFVGLTLFAIGSVGCALAPDIQTLVALRFVQGLGAYATVVIPRAIVRDLHTGHEAARVMAMPMLVLLFIGFGFLGLVMPATAVLALDRHGPIAGTASALMGVLQFVSGALVMAAVGQFVDGSSRPMVVGIGACALLALVISYRTLAKTPAHTAAV
jgi:hypothetical protein